MTATTAVKSAATLVTRGVIDLRTAHGGILTMRIFNGPTGPTAACEGRVLIAHDAGSTPTPDYAGGVWKSAWKFSGGTGSSTDTERIFEVPPGVMHLEVEFFGNTGQAVFVEASMSVVTGYETA
jgi:hypothetical protein